MGHQESEANYESRLLKLVCQINGLPETRRTGLIKILSTLRRNKERRPGSLDNPEITGLEEFVEPS